QAYRSFLVAMDLEMTATVLRRDQPEQAEARLREAGGAFLAALRADPGLDAAEERLLYLAAEYIERGQQERATEVLEDLIGTKPRSWKAHYMLGDLRREAGLPSQAVVAFELSDSLHPLSDADQIRLAQLYAESAAFDSAAARPHRGRPWGTALGSAQSRSRAHRHGAARRRGGAARRAAVAFARRRDRGASATAPFRPGAARRRASPGGGRPDRGRRARGRPRRRSGDVERDRQRRVRPVGSALRPGPRGAASRGCAGSGGGVSPSATALAGATGRGARARRCASDAREDRRGGHRAGRGGTSSARRSRLRRRRRLRVHGRRQPAQRRQSSGARARARRRRR